LLELAGVAFRDVLDARRVVSRTRLVAFEGNR